jgi:hypothetical protein
MNEVITAPPAATSPLVAEKAFSWSYTRKKEFNICRRRYHHLSVLKDYKQPKTPELAEGDHIHAAFQRRVEKGLPMPTAFDYLTEWGHEAAKVIHAKQKVFCEKQVSLNKELQKVGWYDPDAWFRIKIDNLKLFPWDSKNSWAALVIDYKTGVPKDELEQLALYAMCVFILYPEVTAVRTEYWWTKTMDKTVEIFKRGDLEDFTRIMFEEAAEMEEAHRTNNFPPTRNGLCKEYCPVASCEYVGKGGR